MQRHDYVRAALRMFQPGDVEAHAQMLQHAGAERPLERVTLRWRQGGREARRPSETPPQLRLTEQRIAEPGPLALGLDLQLDGIIWMGRTGRSQGYLDGRRRVTRAQNAMTSPRAG
ncbi:hypothetical protein GCM10017781_46440 [Deinococcus metalli]|uniref:Uncharacterized protein n=1 Tax=Deinococcus metalli TaxID=1141878 RepID=A0ABQ3JZK3_9DEIO|nr:hypothetical protein GCM10017781_46440 [Deinococcus metalli]